MPMVTYSDLFQFVIMLCAVITLVVFIERKK
nr:MAG TPA: Membrane MotB of proton-channel complex MotA/MotB [Caudoviricetes sp.]